MESRLSLVGLAFVTALMPGGIAWGQSAISGTVRDVVSGEPVMSALIRVGQTDSYAVSLENGTFRLSHPERGRQVLVVTALGFAKRYHPVEFGVDAEVAIELSPSPIEVQGFQVETRTYAAKLQRRRNSTLARSYVLEQDLLLRSNEKHVWDLVGKKHGFSFDGFDDYGCANATIHGMLGRVSLFIDDREVRIGIFQEHPPHDFALVEIYAYGRQIRAYTGEYMDWMTENGRGPPAFETEARLCPSTRKWQLVRGRWIEVVN